MQLARDREIKMNPRSIPTWPTRHQAEMLIDVDSCFESLKEKRISKNLIKTQRFVFKNSPFTRQSNRYGRYQHFEFDFEQLKVLTDNWQNCLHQLGGSSRFQVWLRKNWEGCFGTTASNFYGQRKKSRTATLLFYNACILRQNTNAVTVRLCVQIWVSFGSSSRWIGPSSREHLRASNVFVWYINNDFVC